MDWCIKIKVPVPLNLKFTNWCRFKLSNCFSLSVVSFWRMPMCLAAAGIYDEIAVDFLCMWRCWISLQLPSRVLQHQACVWPHSHTDHAVGSDHRAAGWTSHESPSMPRPYLQAIKLYVMSGHWSFQKCPHWGRAARWSVRLKVSFHLLQPTG